MDNIVIKIATLENLADIQFLNDELFKLEKENYDKTLVRDWALSDEGKEYFKELITNNYVIVAKLDNEIVGYLAGGINEKGSYEEVQYGEIYNMFIKSTCRGNGIGEKLICNFKEYCKQNGINNLKVTASAKNKNAIEFYHRRGFEDFNLTLTMEIKEKRV